MLITKEVSVKVSKYTLNYYKQKGIDCKINEIITIPTEFLPQKSIIKVKYKCDLCGEIYEIEYANYIKKRERKYSLEGDFCIHCSKKIRTKWMKEYVRKIQCDQFIQVRRVVRKDQIESPNN